MTTTYWVHEDNALIYVADVEGKPPQFHRVGVLAGDPFKGGPDPKNGPIVITGELRPATLKDFSDFRVSPVGHLPEVNAGDTGGSAMPLPTPGAVWMDLVRGPEGWRIRKWSTDPFEGGVRYQHTTTTTDGESNA